jgi:4-amino-4-deoxy-L-arabinose transferase-like glycosyltransferase
MRAPSSPRARWALVVLAAALTLVVIHVTWLLANRRGYPLDVDEAGYMAIALHDHAGLASGGLDGYWHAIDSQYPQAPLVPALTALVYLIHPGIVISFPVILAFFVLLVMSTYAIAERLSGPRIGALAALVIATSPGVIALSRLFIFAVPSAALLAVAVYALLRSDGFRRTGWALATGVVAGLLVLSRTFSVAFVPGLIVAGLLALIVRGPARRWRALANLGLATVAGTAVAATWYWHNYDAVKAYLTSFGYGKQAAEYGSHPGLFSWSRWTAGAVRMGQEELYLPLLLLVVAGLACVAGLAVAAVWRSQERRSALLAVLRSDAAVVAVVAVSGYAALSSSDNRGHGFTMLLLPVLIALALVPLRGRRQATIVAAAVLGAVGLFNLVSSSGLVEAVEYPSVVSIPAFGDVPIADGRDHALAALRHQIDGPELSFASSERRWQEADHAMARFAFDYAGARGTTPYVCFASRHRVFNTNTVQLSGWLWFNREISVCQLLVDNGGDNVQAYKTWIDAAQPNMLETTSTNARDFDPTVNQAYAEAAGRELGFKPVWTLTLPDGRQARIWWRQR